MKSFLIVVLSILTASSFSGVVSGGSGASQFLLSERGVRSAHELGKTVPPVGFVQFCVTNPAECKPKGGKTYRLTLTSKVWELMTSVNSLVNSSVAPRSDQELYGEPELWAFPTNAGDCEDYLLLKKRYLESYGFPSETLRITVVLDEKREGHAVLTVVTTQGDLVLDNRRNTVEWWDATGYTFIKRQSRENPMRWVALKSEKAS